MWFKWLCILIFKCYLVLSAVEFHGPCEVKQTVSTCTTPNNQHGICIVLKKCTKLYNLIATDINAISSSNSTTKEYLRQSQCGVQNSMPLICCPLSGVINTTIHSSPSIEKPKQASSNVECGVPLSQRIYSKVIGGVNASAGDLPWMAALRYRNNVSGAFTYGCGGSLINDRWIVTAAHCIAPEGLDLFDIRLGEINLDDSVSDGVTPLDVDFDRVYIHPQYSCDVKKSIANDIALIRLQQAVTFTNYIKPICLLNLTNQRTNQFYERYSPFIAGWGLIDKEKHRANNLQIAQINVIASNKCKEQYRSVRAATIDDSVICAGKPGRDACQGDSGGPLMIPMNGIQKYYLAGVVSYGVLLCGITDSYPGVYTKVAFFGDWIDNVTDIK